MTIMEPRVAERRKSVSEDRARRRLKWILVALVLVAAVVASFWLVRSPVLSIRQVEVLGAQNARPAAIVDQLGMGIGTPTIDVDGGEITEALLMDPWIKSVDVDVSWPGSVAIEVVEYEGLAPVSAAGQWVLMSIDGAVLTVVAQPGPQAGQVAIDVGQVAPGEVIDDVRVLGALLFLDELRRGSGIVARISAEGDALTALVPGHVVRLGRSVDMPEKAVALETLISAGLVPGALIDLIAPSRPGVSNPEPEVEGEE